eukprot:6176173-Pleurochrysis_carterae.AAC.1
MFFWHCRKERPPDALSISLPSSYSVTLCFVRLRCTLSAQAIKERKRGGGRDSSTVSCQVVGAALANGQLGGSPSCVAVLQAGIEELVRVHGDSDLPQPLRPCTKIEDDLDRSAYYAEIFGYFQGLVQACARASPWRRARHTPHAPYAANLPSLAPLPPQHRTHVKLALCQPILGLFPFSYPRLELAPLARPFHILKFSIVVHKFRPFSEKGNRAC